ncbi:hypothetical protein HK097_003680, partial [Rhizophlyctis rosea]
MPDRDRQRHQQSTSVSRPTASTPEADIGRDPESMEALLQQVIAERNALRLQNDQLWHIINKQRGIIQTLQSQLAANGVVATAQSHGESPIGSEATLPTPAASPLAHVTSPAGKIVARERSVSERLGSANQGEDRRQRTMSENREQGRLARRQSFGERDVVLPAIAVQPPSRKSSAAAGEQAVIAAAAQSSRRTHGRQRSHSASGQPPNIVLPPVPGAVPASGLSPKNSASSLSGVPGGPTDSAGMVGSTTSVGSNVGIYEYPVGDSNSMDSFSEEARAGRTRSTSSSARRQRGQQPHPDGEEDQQQQQQPDRHAPRSAGAPKRVSSAEARRARGLDRPWTGHARLQDVNENDASNSNTLQRSGSVPSALTAQQLSDQVSARLRETSIDASRTNLDSLPGSNP